MLEKGNNIYADRSREETIDWINKTADFGADHIRYALAWGDYYADPEAAYHWTQDYYEQHHFYPSLDKLDSLLPLIASRGLKVVLDYHFPIGGRVPDGLKNKQGCLTERRFTELMQQHWHHMANRYRGNPVVIAYDLLNEPHNTVKKWRPIAKQLIEMIKPIDTQKLIIVESNYGDPRRFKDEFLPFAQYQHDSKVIYSFHSYDPFRFCLKGAYGIAGKPYLGKEHILTMLQPVIDFKKKYKLPVYCGEFGVSNQNHELETSRWMHDMLRILKHNKFNFCYHSFGDNGLFDPRGLALDKLRTAYA